MMIKFDEKIYAFNLKKIIDFVNYSDKTKAKETEILDTYETGEDGKTPFLTAKQIRETSVPGNSQIDNIKYDIVKTLILQIIAGNEDGTNGEIRELSDLDFGTIIAFNTMIAEGLLIEINDII